MKRVTYKVAKAIERAGYLFSTEVNEYFNEYYPYYMEVWIWLWKEKKIYIDIAHYYSSDEITVWDNNYKPIDCIDCFNKHTNPEDAIAEAINHLVDNDLIK